MGRATKLLTILVDTGLLVAHEEAFHELQAKGHKVYTFDEQVNLADVDLILSPKAWRTFDVKALDVTIKTARKQRYG